MNPWVLLLLLPALSYAVGFLAAALLLWRRP
jgi:hypothetical protein